MAKILLIETSTAASCSVALAVDGNIACSVKSAEPRAQASLTAPFIKEVLDRSGIKVSGCDAVCVSSGPGSYTGLRVGVSTAKGLCFSAGIPLLSVNTLDILARQAVESNVNPDGCRYIVPMLDARRMEVYTAVYRLDSGKPVRVSDIEARVIDGESFSRELSEGPVVFIGDGSGKCGSVISSANASFVQVCPDADSMLVPATEAFEQKKFEDTAYFEPFYLKQFVATVSKKSLF